MSRVGATLIAAAVIIVVVLFCSYRTIEVIGVTLGLCELTFVITMFIYRPPILEVVHGAFTMPAEPEYMKLIAANIGAVIMPWMIYFQQSAVVARRLSVQDLPSEKAHTFCGSALTQLIMIGSLVTFATLKTSADLETLR